MIEETTRALTYRNYRRGPSDSVEGKLKYNRERYLTHTRMGISQTELYSLPRDRRLAELAITREILAGQHPAPSSSTPVDHGFCVGDEHLNRIRVENKEALKAFNNQQTGTKEGYVYILINPAWPDEVKIGRALDWEDRLRDFNVGDPNRAYTMPFRRHFQDRVAAEKEAHRLLKDLRLDNEWHRTSVEHARSVIETIHM